MATNDSDEPRGRRMDDEGDRRAAPPTADTEDTEDTEREQAVEQTGGAHDAAAANGDEEEWDTVTESSKESFPASDAPSWLIHRQ